MTTQIPERFVRYLADRDRERITQMNTAIRAMTTEEQQVLREAAVMGFVHGNMHGSAHGGDLDEFPKDRDIVARVLTGCGSAPGYPFLKHLMTEGERPAPDWADVREAARKHGWTRRTEPAGWRPVETDVWGHYPPGEKFIDGEQGWARVGLRDYALVIELTGPPIRIAALGSEVRRDVKLIDPTPAEVLTAARLVGLDGAES